MSRLKSRVLALACQGTTRFPRCSGGTREDSAVRIARLLPDVLGMYFDRDSATVLAQQVRMRGRRVQMLGTPVSKISVGIRAWEPEPLRVAGC